MAYEYNVLGDLLSDPRITPIARDAIRNRDLKQEELWNMTLAQLKEEQFFSGEIGEGIRRLYEAADSGDWYFPLYSEEECAEDEARRGVSLVWFNRCGYHVFILTYQVDGREKLLEKNMEDFARALRLIRDHRERFHVLSSRYITCGFSAGGYLICLWNTKMGYPAYGLPKPQASFPVYPVVSLKESIRYGAADPEEAIRLYGCPVEEAAQKEYESPEHAGGFPPSAIFLAAEDGLVNPENSKMLARALEALKIPCKLEIGPTGGHGFADGSGMCMAGWPERAVRWFEGLRL